MFILLVGLNVLATFINTCLCVYVTSNRIYHRYDDLMCDMAYIFSVLVIIMDIIYCVFN